jgi:hypothetical protein
MENCWEEWEWSGRSSVLCSSRSGRVLSGRSGVDRRVDWTEWRVGVVEVSGSGS